MGRGFFRGLPANNIKVGVVDRSRFRSRCLPVPLWRLLRLALDTCLPPSRPAAHDHNLSTSSYAPRRSSSSSASAFVAFVSNCFFFFCFFGGMRFPPQHSVATRGRGEVGPQILHKYKQANDLMLEWVSFTHAHIGGTKGQHLSGRLLFVLLRRAGRRVRVLLCKGSRPALQPCSVTVHLTQWLTVCALTRNAIDSSAVSPLLLLSLRVRRFRTVFAPSSWSLKVVAECLTGSLMLVPLL